MAIATQTLVDAVEHGLIHRRDVRKYNPPTHDIETRMRHYHIPGVSVAVLQDGEIAWTKGYGVREAGLSGSITPETRFQGASIAKPLLALLVLRLVEAGYLDLDKDINDYLTSWRVPAVDGWQPRLTLRHLLTHSGGTTVIYYPGYPQGHPIPSLVEMLNGDPIAGTYPVTVENIPGAQFRYSGGGTTIAMQAILDVMKTPYPDLAREWVLDPLGMDRSTFQQPLPPDAQDDVATGHYRTGQPIGGRWFNMPAMATDGLWTTPSDLARFIAAMQQAMAGEHPVITPHVAHQMFTPHMDVPWDTTDVCLGIFTEHEGNYRYMKHVGWNVGYKGEMVGYLYTGEGAIVMTNGDNGNYLVPEILWSISRAYGWQQYMVQATKPPITNYPPVESFVGDYQFDPGAKLTVRQDGEQLFLKIEDQPELPLSMIGGSEFNVHTLECLIRFEYDFRGVVEGVTLRQNGVEKTAERLP